MLTERQKKAETLARELRAAGANVTSPLPLYDESPLRFRVSAVLAESIVEELRAEGWDPRFVTSEPEFSLDGTTKPSHTFEINLPSSEQQCREIGSRVSWPLAIRNPPRKYWLCANTSGSGRNENSQTKRR